MTAARSTTILSVRKGDQVALGGDGQVTLGNVVAKADATKIRRVGPGGNVLGGFAGSAGGPYAQAAAKALLEHSTLSAKDIVESALKIAGEICIYTNTNVRVETL